MTADRLPPVSFASRLRRLRRAPVKVITTRLIRLATEIADAPHEMRLGIRTGLVTGQFIDHTAQIIACEPVPYRTLGAVARHMTRNRIAAPRFADLGTGMGRPLYYFASRFDELVGYEIVAPIHALSAAHLARVRARRPAYAKIALELADATLAVPLDRPIVLFLYNPFGPKPLARLGDRLRQAQGEVHLYYVNSLFAEPVAAALGPPAGTFHSEVPVSYFHRPGR